MDAVSLVDDGNPQPSAVSVVGVSQADDAGSDDDDVVPW